MYLSPSMSLSILLGAFVLIMIVFLVKKSKNDGKIRKQKLPPGELGLPWIGETLEFFRAQRKNRLFEEFIQPRIAKHGSKTFKTRLMGSQTVVVNGAGANHFFLSNEFKLVVSSWPSSSVQLMGEDSIMAKQGEAHRFFRGIIASTLSSSGLEALIPKVCDTVRLHLQNNWPSNGGILRLFHSVKLLTFTIVFECLLGVKAEARMLDTFERVLEGVFATPINFPGSGFSRAKKARKEIEIMLGGVVKEKRKEMDSRGENDRVDRPDDQMLFSRLVGGLILGEISEKEVIDNVVLLVFAAHDTTSFAIAMMFRMLAHHPDCYSLLLQEHVEIVSLKGEDENLTYEDTKKMRYTWQVARETMRLFPPIFGSFRKAIVDIEYDGFTIPKGWKVLWTAYGTHYEEEYFKDPMEFKPSRFGEAVPSYAFVAFGGGQRLCAGYQLAKLNILIFIHYVVTRFDWSLIHPNEPITVDPLPLPSLGMPIHISPKLL